MAQTRQLALPAYLVGGALLLIPPIDTFLQTIPPRLSDPKWRFGYFGLSSNAMMLTAVGFLVVYMAAELFEHRRFQRVLGIFAAVFAVLILLSAGLFALDVLQVRNQVAARGALAYKVASVTALVKWGIAFATMAAFSWASLRSGSGRSSASSPAAKEKRSSAMLVGSRPSAQIPAPTPAAAPDAE